MGGQKLEAGPGRSRGLSGGTRRARTFLAVETPGTNWCLGSARAQHASGLEQEPRKGSDIVLGAGEEEGTLPTVGHLAVLQGEKNCPEVEDGRHLQPRGPSCG